MRIVINIKENGGGVGITPRLDGGSKDTKFETRAGERLFSEINALLDRITKGAEAAAGKPRRLEKLLAWLKRKTQEPV